MLNEVGPKSTVTFPRYKVDHQTYGTGIIYALIENK